MEIQISSENGIVPSRDQDCAARLQKLLKAGTMDTIFVLSPGEYFLASAIKLEGLQNVKIIGYGARFISRYDPCDPYSFRGAFDFTGCKSCTISGLTLTTDRDPNCAGHVEAVNVDECTVDIALDEGFHLSGKESIRCVDSCDERLIPNKHIYFADDHGYRYSLIRENVIRLYAGRSNQGQLRSLLAGEPVCMKHSLYPHCPLLFTECSGMELNDITVESSPGVTCGIYPRSENFTFRRFQIRLPYGSKRIYASNADGIHVTGLAGKLVIEDCLFEHLGDDAINIHNEGATVYKLEGDVVTCYARRFYSEPDENAPACRINGPVQAIPCWFTIGKPCCKRAVSVSSPMK